MRQSFEQARAKESYKLALILLAVFWTFACTSQQEATETRSGGLEALLAKISSADENGDPIASLGFEVQASVAENDNRIELADLVASQEADQKLFEYSAPKDSSAVFSQPKMVTAAFLKAPSLEGECADLKYQPVEPTIKEVLQQVKAAEICGTVKLTYCIKVTLTNMTGPVYLKTPSFRLNLSCPTETFAAVQMLINDGAKLTAHHEVSLSFSSGPLITDLYVTNTPGCQEGGSWQSMVAKIQGWQLSKQNADNTVYVAFRDALGRQSDCLSQSITHQEPDSTPPTEASLSIAGGAAYTTSSSVTLTLAASGASDMYVTNSAGCSSGGNWETYATTKAWTLAQTQGTATVYVAYRDRAGNAICVSDTITHDAVPPTATSISISSGASYSTSTSVTLGLSGTDADTMYITNTAGCASGGTWEAFTSTKTAWPLAQSNATASVYAKFKDLAGNSSACISDTIIHDGIAPPAPSSFDDGLNTGTATASPIMSWNAVSEAGSGIATYQLAIGTNAGDTDVKDWTAVGNVTTASMSGLTLSLGLTYYGSVRAMDQAGNISSVSSGDGFTYTTQWVQQAFIKAANNDTNDSFGENIALDNDTLAVVSDMEDSAQTTVSNGTAASADNSLTDSGAVYIYKRTATAWAQEAYIKSLNAGNGDGSRASVALQGDTLVVGMQEEDSAQTTIFNGSSASTDDSATNAGAVFVYTRAAASWAQQAYLKAANSDSNDNFGFHVSLAGNTLAVSADVEDSDQTTITNGPAASANNTSGGSGAVYIYARTASAWAQEAYIKASNNDVDDSFGESISLFADTLAVGADQEDSQDTTITNGTLSSTDNNASNAGAVYIYKRNAGSWAQEAFLKAANARADDSYGSDVALYGDTLAVAADYEDSEQTTITNGTTASTGSGATDSGAVYIYKRAATTWTQEAYIKAANAGSSDKFGHSLSLHADTLVVGVEDEDSNQTTITNGTTASTNDSANSAGAAYVYKRTATAWAQEAYLKAANAAADDWFGYKVSVYGNTIAVAADGEDSLDTTIINGTGVSTDDSNLSAGAVYIYTR